MTTRWTLTSVDTGDSWTMPINPNTMSSVNRTRQVDTFSGGVTSRVRSFERAAEPVKWTWAGVIRSKDHYDALAAWARRPGKVRVTDHLGRTFEVLMQQFEPEDRKPTAKVDWRLRYTMQVVLLRRVS